jgi:hypothetical protein
MNVLSIDIGIKNLAFCIANVKSDKHNKKLIIDIIDWKIINLVESVICQEIKSCKCNAKFYLNKLDISNNEYPFYVCNKHSLKYNKNELNKFKNESSNVISLINISDNIIKHLDKYFIEIREKKKFNIKCLNNIIIENQIGPLAIRMKSIQAMITMYFVYNKNKNIDYINSSNKLKFFIEKTKSYNERKKKSIEITKTLLENTFNDKLYHKSNNNYNINILDNNKIWLNEFDNNPKKDDLADCLLQLLYFSIENYL